MSAIGTKRTCILHCTCPLLTQSGHGPDRLFQCRECNNLDRFSRWTDRSQCRHRQLAPTGFGVTVK